MSDAAHAIIEPRLTVTAVHAEAGITRPGNEDLPSVADAAGGPA